MRQTVGEREGEGESDSVHVIAVKRVDTTLPGITGTKNEQLPTNVYLMQQNDTLGTSYNAGDDDRHTYAS